MARHVNTEIDPALESQLSRADEGRSVAATFTLRNTKRGFRSAGETETVVRKVIERAIKRTRAQPKDVTVFPNMQSFAVDAPPVLVRELISQPEIETAVANEQHESMLIEPVEVREVPAEEVEGRVRRPTSRRGRSR